MYMVNIGPRAMAMIAGYSQDWNAFIPIFDSIVKNARIDTDAGKNALATQSSRLGTADAIETQNAKIAATLTAISTPR